MLWSLSAWLTQCPAIMPSTYFILSCCGNKFMFYLDSVHMISHVLRWLLLLMLSLDGGHECFCTTRDLGWHQPIFLWEMQQEMQCPQGRFGYFCNSKSFLSHDFSLSLFQIKVFYSLFRWTTLQWLVWIGVDSIMFNQIICPYTSWAGIYKKIFF